MKNYLQFFQKGGIPEENLIRLDNNPNKGALIQGDLALALNKIKEIIINFKNKVQTYDRVKKVISETPQNSTDNSNNKTDGSIAVASVGYIDTPFKVNKLSSDFWSNHIF